MSNDYVTKSEFYTALAALARAGAQTLSYGRPDALHAIAETFMVAATPTPTKEDPVIIPTVALDEKPVLRKGAPDTEPPTTREVVSTTFPVGMANVPLMMRLRRRGPGDVILEAFAGESADGSSTRSVASVPWDNLVKMCVRLDPDHATEAQRQVADARRQMGEAQAAMYDKEAQIVQLKAQLATAQKRVEELSGTFAYSRTPSPVCAGDCSRGGEGPACGLPGCKG